MIDAISNSSTAEMHETVNERRVSIVKNQAKLLAEGVQLVLCTPHSITFLETIFVPFIAHFNYFNQLKPLRKPEELIFRNFSEFYDFVVDVESKNSLEFEYDIEWKEGDYDFVVIQPLNIYERFVYSLRRISYLEMKYVASREVSEVEPDFESRNNLKKLVMSGGDTSLIPELIDCLPYTLFEKLKNGKNRIKYPSAKVHWLGQIHNENYLFYLAHIKEKGAVIIGQPHGGMFCQMQCPPGNEIAESILADHYLTPIWQKDRQAFPSLRASRNLFISIKNITLKKKKKMLVLLGFLYMNTEPIFNRALTNNVCINDFYHTQLRNLKDHFGTSFDFKIHPTQKEDALAQLRYLYDLYPDCEILTSGGAQRLSHGYAGVIHLDAWGTAIIELAASRIPQYVYVGPEILLNESYGSFLWNTRKSSTRIDRSSANYVKVNNFLYRSAYGASYLYAFHFANLIKEVLWKKEQSVGVFGSVS